MITALILSGGTGTRFGGDIPKQYILVKNIPVIGFCIKTFQNNSCIDKIIVVAASEWHDFIAGFITEERISKFSGFAPAGKSRQHSILNGLKKIIDIGGKNDDLVLIHDAARPCVSDEIINNCVDTLKDYDMAMPVISVKDTIYTSTDGEKISGLLNRKNLFAGQTPEGCHLGKYYDINASLSDKELSNITGTSAAGYEHGLSIGIFAGSEANFKITMFEDLQRFDGSE